MAHVHEEVLTITISKLVKLREGEECTLDLVDDTILAQLELLVGELVSDSSLVVDVRKVFKDGNATEE